MADTTTPGTGVESLDEGSIESALDQQFSGKPQEERKPEQEDDVATDDPESGLNADDLANVDGEDKAEQDAKADDFALDIVHNGAQVKLSKAETVKYAQIGLDADRKYAAAGEMQRTFQAGLQRIQELEQVQPLLAQEMGQVAALHMRLQDARYSDAALLQLAQSGDIIEYQTREAERNILRNQFQATSGQFQQKAWAVQQYRAQLMDAQLQQEHARLPEVIPAWRDQGKMEQDKGEMGRYLQHLGVDMSQVGRYLDSAIAMKVVRDAMNYGRLSKLKADKSKQLRAAPPVIRPGANAPSDQGRAAFAKTAQAIKRAGQQGNRRFQEDAMVSLLNKTFPK